MYESVCVNLYLCISVFMHEFMHVYAYEWMWVCMYYAWIRVCMYVSNYACTRMYHCTCMYECTLCKCPCMYVWTCACMTVCAHVCMHDVCTCMYVCYERMCHVVIKAVPILTALKDDHHQSPISKIPLQPPTAPKETSSTRIHANKYYIR